MHARMHAKHKHAPNFQMSSAAILNPFLTENEKKEATLQIGIDESQLFHFIIVPKMERNPLFLPLVAKICNLGIKVMKKKFHHVLKGHVQLFCFIYSFQFSKEILQNGWNVPKKVQNSPFFTSGGLNLTLRNKSWNKKVRAGGPYHTPEPPAGARIFWRVEPKNSSNDKIAWKYNLGNFEVDG